MAMTLYNNDLSPFTARVRMQIRAKGLEGEIAIKPPPAEGYKDIIFTARVPGLDTGTGFRLPESEVIVEYIEDRFPARSLRGEGPEGAAKVRLVARIVDVYFQSGLGILFGQFAADPRDPKLVAEGIGKIEEALGYLEALIEGPAYAFENRVTLADCVLIAPLFFSGVAAPAFGADVFAGAPKVKAYFDALVANDAAAAKTVGEIGAALAAFQAARR